jgi:tetratricopeptide (TPR) repeat protein
MRRKIEQALPAAEFTGQGSPGDLTRGDPRSSTTASENSSSRIAAAHARLSEAEQARLAGDPGRAQSLCQGLLKDFPDYVGALQTLGAAHLQRKSYGLALPCFLQAAMRCPQDAVNLTNLATCYFKLNAAELALRTLGDAERLAPDDLHVHWVSAEVHHAKRDYIRAAQSFERVLLLSPAHAEAAHGLGDCLLHLGRTEDAASMLQRAHSLRPESVTILYSLSQLPAAATDVDLLSALDRVRRFEELTEDEFEARLAFTRAAALDRLGRYGEAWTVLLEANRREFPKHKRAYERHRVRMEAIKNAALRATISPAQESAGEMTPLSLFIIGPSRAGKTTLENLIGHMPQVKRGFERRLIESATRRASQLAGLLTIDDPAALPKSLDDRLRRLYCSDLVEFAAGARIVTDTHPGMIVSVGRVAAALTNVRFVFVKRDPFDVAMRIFMRPYRAGNPYAYDIGTIFEYLSWYDQMIDLWCARLPGMSLCVDYEQMIDRPELVLREVAKLCGTTALNCGPHQLADDRGCSAPYRSLIEAEVAKSA